jgi:phage gp29-like protein
MAYIPAPDQAIRMTTNAQLRERAEKGDTLAQAELARRKANRSERTIARKPVVPTAAPAFAWLSAPVPAAVAPAPKKGRTTVKSLEERMSAIEGLLMKLVQQ